MSFVALPLSVARVDCARMAALAAERVSLIAYDVDP